MSKLQTNVVLGEAIDRAVYAGLVQPKAQGVLYDLLESRCMVDPEKNRVLIRDIAGETIDECVAAFCKEHDFLAPPKDSGPSAADQLKALQDEAAAGSVTAHGALHKQMGAEAYEAWRAANGARPGKRVDANPNQAALDEIRQKLDALEGGGGSKINGAPAGKDNPWSKDGWNITRQGSIVRALGAEKAGQIAAAARSHIGATRPTP